MDYVAGYVLEFETHKKVREVEVKMELDREAARQLDKFITENGERVGNVWRLRVGYAPISLYNAFRELLRDLEMSRHIQNIKWLKNKMRNK